MFRDANDMESNSDEESTGTSSEDEDEVDSVPYQNLCEVCLTRTENAAFTCGHRVCYTCGEVIRREPTNKKCPIC